MSQDVSWTVSPEDAGQRLDRFVAERLDLPRNQVRRWILDGRLQLSDRAAKPGSALRAGERVDCSPPTTLPDARLEPENGDLVVLHEDRDLVVLDKPADLAVHPGAGRENGTLVNRLLARYPDIAGVGGEGRPGIVHRLDLDTTGAIAIARTEAAYQKLSAAFAARKIDKTYLAIAYGTPRVATDRIDLPIGRHRHHRKQMQIRSDGRPAVTHYLTLESTTGLSRLELDLETGRTHQIRIHLKALGHPLVGDPVYGEARWRNLPRPVQPALRNFPRPALHAWKLAFGHPISGQRIVAEAPLPEDMRQLWLAVTGREWLTNET